MNKYILWFIPVIILVAVLSISIFNPEFFAELRYFPFHAAVWGTFSDFVYLIVASITAYYLYQTLKSQKEVQQDQHRLTIRQILEPGESLMPIFEFYQNSGYPFRDQKVSGNTITGNILLRSNYHTATDVTIRFSSLDGKVVAIKKIDSIKKHIIIPMKAKVKFEDVNKIAKLTLFIEYKDIIGKQYNQTGSITIDFNTGSGHDHTEPPEYRGVYL